MSEADARLAVEHGCRRVSPPGRERLYVVVPGRVAVLVPCALSVSGLPRSPSCDDGQARASAGSLVAANDEIVVPNHLPRIARLRNAVEKLSWRNAERVGQLDDGAEPRFADGAFQPGYLGGVQIAGVAERFLGELYALALSSDVATKDLLGLLHTPDRACS